MSRRVAALAGLALCCLALAAPAASASPSGIHGTLLDATCGSDCGCPPPPVCRGAAICANGRTAPAIVCPQRAAPAFCIAGRPCPGWPVYPVYEGEGAHVLVRRAGAAAVIARRDPRAGRFSVRLRPGLYVVRAYVSLPCWRGQRRRVRVRRGRFTQLALQVRDACVVHPDG